MRPDLRHGLASARPGLALGISMGSRGGGVALLTRERLVHTRGVSLARIPPHDHPRHAKAELDALLHAYRPACLVLVEVAGDGGRPLGLSLRAWLVHRARSLALSSARLTAAQVREQVPEPMPTNAGLARTLTARFPELSYVVGQARSPTPPGVRARLPTPRERHHYRLLLGLGGALHQLDRQLTEPLIS